MCTGLTSLKPIINIFLFLQRVEKVLKEEISKELDEKLMSCKVPNEESLPIDITESNSKGYIKDKVTNIFLFIQEQYSKQKEKIMEILKPFLGNINEDKIEIIEHVIESKPDEKQEDITTESSNISENSESENKPDTENFENITTEVNVEDENSESNVKEKEPIEDGSNEKLDKVIISEKTPETDSIEQQKGEISESNVVSESTIEIITPTQNKITDIIGDVNNKIDETSTDEKTLEVENIQNNDSTQIPEVKDEIIEESPIVNENNEPIFEEVKPDLGIPGAEEVQENSGINIMPDKIKQSEITTNDLTIADAVSDKVDEIPKETSDLTETLTPENKKEENSELELTTVLIPTEEFNSEINEGLFESNNVNLSNEDGSPENVIPEKSEINIENTEFDTTTEIVAQGGLTEIKDTNTDIVLENTEQNNFDLS